MEMAVMRGRGGAYYLVCVALADAAFADVARLQCYYHDLLQYDAARRCDLAFYNRRRMGARMFTSRRRGILYKHIPQKKR